MDGDKSPCPGVFELLIAESEQGGVVQLRCFYFLELFRFKVVLLCQFLPALLGQFAFLHDCLEEEFDRAGWSGWSLSCPVSCGWRSVPQAGQLLRSCPVLGSLQIFRRPRLILLILHASPRSLMTLTDWES